MTVTHSIFGVIAACGAILAAAGAQNTYTPRYEIIDLGTLGGFTSAAFGMNDVGQVVGGADLPDGSRHTFLWESGEMTDLGVLEPWSQGEGWDVNNAGDVVGISTNTGNLSAATRWRQGTIIDLGYLTGAPTGDAQAYAVNDGGHIVGVSVVAFNTYDAFLWVDGVMTDLSEAFDVGPGAAWDINEPGRVLKGSKILNVDGSVTTLPTLGGDFVQGLALNDPGQVVGKSKRAGSETTHAFFWDDGVMTDIGAASEFASSRASALNNGGQVVGWGFVVESDIIESFLYHSDVGMVGLHDLIPPEGGWLDLIAQDINDAGQIAGTGTHDGDRHAFLMTPLPVPAVSMWGMIIMTLAVLTGGSIAITRRRTTA